MISRLSINAVVVAIVTACTVAMAQSEHKALTARQDVAAASKTVQLERVVITGKRIVDGQ